MKILKRVLWIALFVLPQLAASPCWAQATPQKSESKTAAAPAADDNKKNTDAYIALMRRDIRQEKAEIMGSVMVLNAQDAAKFWPIYSAYDQELTKLNDQRVENIKDYARNYDQMTDAKADELIQKFIAYQKQRNELLAKTYDQVRDALGAINAARFAQVEHQLLLLIDLQIAASLPVVGSGS
jgi:hypothetical protein